MPRTPAEKLDLYKVHKSEYVAPKDPVLLEVKRARYLTVVGAGQPGGEQFQACVGALYAMAYTIKMTRKFAGAGDYKVCHLEGLYWGADPERCMTEQPPESWNWKLMIRVPDFITARDLKDAAARLKEKGKDAEGVRLETITEGKCVQVLHVGPYAEEGRSVERMAAAVAGHGLALCGPHHEIYLSDPRRVPPERLRTILREPVGAATE